MAAAISVASIAQARKEECVGDQGYPTLKPLLECESEECQLDEETCRNQCKCVWKPFSFCLEVDEPYAKACKNEICCDLIRPKCDATDECRWRYVDKIKEKPTSGASRTTQTYHL